MIYFFYNENIYHQDELQRATLFAVLAPHGPVQVDAIARLRVVFPKQFAEEAAMLPYDALLDHFSTDFAWQKTASYMCVTFR